MSASVKGRLSGDTSRNLATTIKKMTKFDRLVSILKFFNHQDGDQELWYMISIMKGKGPSDEGA